MIFKIGKINILPWLTDYNIQLAPQFGNEQFTDINGETVRDYRGDKAIVTFSLKRVPAEAAAAVSSALSAEEFSCTLSSPTEISGNFRKTSYRAEPYEKGLKWHFDVTAEAVSLINSGNCL